MANTPLMSWPFPAKDLDPHYDALEAFVNQQDVSAYAHREDRNVVVMGGGEFTLNAAGNTLSWDATLEVLSPVVGFLHQAVAGSVAINDGQILYLKATRRPTKNITVTLAVADRVPNDDDSILLAIRRGAIVYFRNGITLTDGSPAKVFEEASSGAGGVSSLFQMIPVSGPAVVAGGVGDLQTGGAPFSVLKYPEATTFTFDVVLSVKDESTVGQAYLFNVTDNKIVNNSTLSVTGAGSTVPQRKTAVLTADNAANNLKDAWTVYEVRINNDGIGTDETLLGSAFITVE